MWPFMPSFDFDTNNCMGFSPYWMQRGGGVILIDKIFPIAIMLTWLKRHNGIHALCKWNLVFTFWSFLSIVGNGLHVHMYISFRNCGNSNCNKICSNKILLTKIGFDSMVFVKKTVGLSKINPYRKELEKSLHLGRLCCHWIFSQGIPAENAKITFLSHTGHSIQNHFYNQKFS